jgi:1-acyl-sn-glycerol-3-phosphate acyltransferase
MKALRSFFTLTFFILFGFGGVILSYLILPFVWKRTTALKIVRAIWWVILQGFILTRLIRIDQEALAKEIRGAVILANHPSLIDVIILTVLIPNTFSVAKHALRKNPFIGMIVRRAFLHDDAQLLTDASPLLAQEYNILIFPEGTRSPSPSTMHKWHRGGTQLALRTQAPLQPIALHYDYRMLAKGQNILDMGTRPVTITLTTLPQIPPTPTTHYHPLAVRLTNEMKAAIETTLSAQEAHT